MFKNIFAITFSLLFSLNSFADAISCQLYDDEALIRSKTQELDTNGNADLELGSYDIHYFGATMRDRDILNLWLASPIEETHQQLTGTISTRSSRGTLITFKCDYIP